MTSPSGAEDGHGPPQHPQQPLQPTALHRTGSSRRMASRLEVELPANALATGAIHLIQKPITSPRTAALSQEERLAMAERRRQEFRLWLSSRKQRSAAQQEGGADEAWRASLLVAKQERHEQVYAAQLEARRSRAGMTAARRAAALQRRAANECESLQNTAQRLQEQQDEAEQRRRSMLDLERERLKQEHQLVLTRLNMRREDDPSREEQRRRLEQRLSMAEQTRQELLGLRARRAGAKAARARTQGTQARAAQQQKAEARRLQLEERLRLAEHRRAAALASSPRSPGPLGNGLSSPSPRVSATGTGAGGGAYSASASATPSTSAFTTPAASPMPLAASLAVPAVTGGLSVKTTPSAQPLPAAQAEAAVQHSNSQLPTPASTPAGQLAVCAGAGDERKGAAVPSEVVAEGGEREAAVADLNLRVEGLRRHISCRKLQQCWRNFVRKHRTTRALAAAFINTGITSMPLPQGAQPSAATAAAASNASAAPAAAVGRSEPVAIIGALSPRLSSPRGIDRFDQFAAAMRDPATLRSAQVLLRRLERRLGGCGRPLPSCAALLLRLFPNSAAYQEQARVAARRSGSMPPPGLPPSAGGPGGAATGGDRYPARVFLTAWMVVKYPEVVFNAVGAREQRLADHAAQLVTVFEALLAQLVDVDGAAAADASADTAAAAAAALPPSPLLSGMRLVRLGLHGALGPGVPGGGDGVASALGTTAALLLRFDEVWLQYLDQFVAWKTEDAASLESELIRMAAQMERSLRRKLGSPPGGGSGEGRKRAEQDLAAMEEQVAHDHGLLRERVARLSGPGGVARLEAAIAAAREAAAESAGWTSTDVSASEPDSDREGGPGGRAGARALRLSSSGGAPSVGAAAAASPGAAARAASSGAQGDAGTAASAPATSPSAAPAAAPSAPMGPIAASVPAKPSKAGGLTRGFFKSPAPSQKPAPSAASASPAAPVPGGRTSAPSSSSAPAPASAGLGHALTSPRSPSAPTLGLSPDALANLAMVNDLLHAPSKQLPSTDLEASLQALWDQGSEREPPPPPPQASAAGAGPPGLPLLDPSELEGLGPEEAVALLKARAKAVAERAFWDAQEQRVLKGLQSGNLLLAAAPLAAEVGRELADLVTDPTLSARLSAEFGASDSSDRELAERLEEAARQAAAAATAHEADGGRGLATAASQAAAAAAAAATAGLLPASLPGLLMLLERLGSLLIEYGAPARRSTSAEAQQRLRDELSASLAALAAANTAPASPAPEPAHAAGGAGPAPSAAAASKALARSLTRAMRLLHLQMKQVKLDAANAKLAALGQQLGGAAGVQYVQDKFRAMYRLDPHGTGGDGAAAAEAASGGGAEGSALASLAAAPARALPTERLVSALPKTWAWLLQAVQAAPAMQGYCRTALGLDLDAAVAAARQEAAAATAAGMGTGAVHGAGAGAPAVIRTGRAASAAAAAAAAVPSSSSPGAGDAAGISAPRPELAPKLPVSLTSVEGLVRAGLVTLISGGTPAAGSNLPEALTLDIERLHALQNQFQSLVVVAASFLLVSQFRSQYAAAAAAPEASQPNAPTHAASPTPAATAATPATGSAQQQQQQQLPWDRAAAKARLQVLLADPSLQLQHLVAELSHMAGLTSAGLPPDQQSKAEAQLRQALLRVVDPAGAAFRSLSNGLAAALLACLLCGTRGEATAAMVSRLLGRIGAGLLVPDVLKLAAQLGTLAGVLEAVHGQQLLTPLVAKALTQVGAAGLSSPGAGAGGVGTAAGQPMPSVAA